MAREVANRVMLRKRVQRISTIRAVLGVRRKGRPRRSRAGVRSDVSVPAVLERANELLDPDDRHTAKELGALSAFFKAQRVARSWKLQYLQRRDWVESGVSWGLRCAVARVLTSLEANAPEIEEDAEYCSHLPLLAARPLSGAGNNAGSAWAAPTQGAARAQQHLGDDDSVAPVFSITVVVCFFSFSQRFQLHGAGDKAGKRECAHRAARGSAEADQDRSESHSKGLAIAAKYIRYIGGQHRNDNLSY